MMKKWITFDLDGTLMQNPFSNWVFPEIVSDIQEYLKSDIDIRKLIVDEHNGRMSENKVLEAYDWDNIVENTLSTLNVSRTIDVEQIVKRHSVSPKIYLLEDDIINNLENIKKIGYNLAVATNGYLKYQLPVIRELGIEDVFDKIKTPDKCGFAKPNVGMVRSLKEEGEVLAHVGDRIDHDIIMANQLGITSILIDRKLPQHIKDIPADQRNKNHTFLSLCEEKWKSENNIDHISFEEKCIPDIAVHSIKELLNYLKGIEF